MTKWNVGGVTLRDGPFMIGAGVCKNPSVTKEWLKVTAGVSGSYTPLAREVNPGKVFYPDTLEKFLTLGYGLNAFGMPNMGFTNAATAFIGELFPLPLIVSIAGFSVSDYIEGIAIFQELKNVAAIELNFGCPNTQHGQIMSFMRADVEAILSSVKSNGKPIWVKFSPYANPLELKRMALAINNHPNLVRAVVAINTFPNAYAGKGKIDPNQGRAGFSGPAILQEALGQVHQFREYLDSSIDVIGVGGITTGDDIMEFLDAGAAAVQLTSLPFWAGSPKVFLEHLMDERTSSRFLEYLENNN